MFGDLIKVITAPVWLLALVAVGIVRAVGPPVQKAWRWLAGRKGANDLRDAAFASDRELRKRGYLDPAGGYLVGLTSSGKRVFTNREDSALIVGRKGAGKSQTMIASIRAFAAGLGQATPDIIVTDPVGEIERATRDQLERAGYGVLVLNLADPANALHGYNPLNFVDVFDDYEFDIDLTTLAELLVPPDVHTRDEHFVDIAQALVTSALGYFLRYEPRNASLAHIAQSLAANREGFDALLKKIAVAHEPIIQQGVTAINAAGQKNERGSIFTSMSRKLRPYMTKAVERLTDLGHDDNGARRRGWTWEDILEGERPTIVYVRTGLGRGAVSGPFVRLVMGNAINTARRILVRRGPLERGLRIFVDEARDIGNCRAIIDANNELRKANVSVFLCYLAMKDIRSSFPDWETLVGGCALIVPGGMNDIGFYEEVSRSIGEVTAYTHSEYEETNGSRRGRSETRERLIRADQLRRLPPGEFVVVMGDVVGRLRKPFAIRAGRFRRGKRIVYG